MIIIKPKAEFVVTVEAELTPDLAEKDIEEVKKFKVYYGKDLVELGELFEVVREGDDKKLVLEGDFSKVKWIGCRMAEGEIVVKGSVGANCGAYMAGGRIVIEGDADDWLGAEMKDGEITVMGNAGNLVGCAYYGNATGMNGGKITIEGNAGNYIGEKMAGGEIEIKGNAGDFIGTEMKGGVIKIHGSCGFVGGDMKAGEIRIGGDFELMPTFVKGEDGWSGDMNVKGEGVVKKL
ncbi:formylmethanofuran dehydrogenase subunit C [Archaeoglobus neptunius]|uniref:formylmethanofuran dehydrogenase subunit C n=1 Tax=Archaeoglobus neptunius TaxID=2798580 RepID=UPI0019276C54|nr:formylmethanofuran dehydrogenase subunit C [Archaeoglobus neptunius]